MGKFSRHGFFIERNLFLVYDNRTIQVHSHLVTSRLQNRECNYLGNLAQDLLCSTDTKDTQGFFITGTDTGVGKTLVSCALIKEFQRRQIKALGLKPICCGDRADTLKFWELSDRKIPINLINPIHLPYPVAPVSQPCPPWPTLLRRVQRAFLKCVTKDTRILLVEGAGGLLCPITRKQTMRELAKTLHLPLVLVARDRLGVLNHTLLTLEAAQSAGLKCAAIVLNRIKQKSDSSSNTNRHALSQLTNIPIYYHRA